MWFMFLLGVACIVTILVWDLRRKAAGREAASRERFEQIFQLKQDAVAAPLSRHSGSPNAGVAVAAQPRAAFSGLAVRERFLSQPQTLVYLLLRTGLPEFQIFANVTLASVLSAPGAQVADRVQQLQRQAQCRLDFVVCDRGMHIAAVVELDAPSGDDAPGLQRYKSDCLAAAGVRVVSMNPLSLPSRGDVRRLVCGATDAAAK